MPVSKRAAESLATDGPDKKVKYSKFKSTNRGKDDQLTTANKIKTGTAGIWATCVRGLEGKATNQLRDVLEEYAMQLYPDAFPDVAAKGKSLKNEDDDGDIEAAIKAELQDAKNVQKNQVFKTVRIDVACVLYFIVEPPVDPVALVHRICEDAAAGLQMKQTRHVNRLTPIQNIGKATPEGLLALGKEILTPHFGSDGPAKRYAIRPTIRNHDILKRMAVIETLANMVDDKHTVDLKNPEWVILVEVYTGTVGISIVTGDFEGSLKRFNLNELYAIGDASHKAKIAEAEGKDEENGGKIDKHEGDESMRPDETSAPEPPAEVSTGAPEQ